MQTHVSISLVFSLLITWSSYSQKNTYLNQKPPSTTPEKFAPGIISKPNQYEFGSVFNKDATAFYFGVNNGGKEEIRYTALVGEKWTAPKVLMADDKYGYNDPFLSPDETRLYYISQRPLDGKGESKDYDIWYSERTKNGWSEPVNAGKHINTRHDEYYISFTSDGTLYFSSSKTNNNFDIYASKFVDNSFQKAEVLGKAINTKYYEADVFIAPDESYIIFCANRPEGYGRGDLYISFKNKNGEWTPSVNMGDAINTKGHELCPFVSKDGKYFFYTSNQDIYWVSTAIFKNYK